MLTRNEVEQNLIYVSEDGTTDGKAHSNLLTHDTDQRQTIEVQAKELQHWREAGMACRATDGHSLVLNWRDLEQRIMELEEHKEIADWYQALVSRACIGTKKTPSLKAYIEQLEAELAMLKGAL